MSNVVYAEIKCCLSCCKELECLHCCSCRMCWHSSCSPVAKPLWNGHIPLTSFAPATVLVPHTAVCHTVEVIQSENNFLEQSCCLLARCKTTSELAVTQHSQTSWLTIHCISFSVLTGFFWLMLSHSILLKAFSFHSAHLCDVLGNTGNAALLGSPVFNHSYTTSCCADDLSHF